jgi:N-acetylglucosaminyl-diphospho-decaprenol L-rhamnosyltransferase
VDRVAAVVVTHGPDPDLGACLAALAAEAEELVVVANLGGPPPAELPASALYLANRRPAGFAANANRGIAATTAPLVVVANPDAVAAPGAVARLAAHMEAHPRCGVAGPALLYPDGSPQPSRRRFPTVWGTLVRRTPLRLALPPERFSRSHYALDEPPPEGPVLCDWMLGAFLMLRRTMWEEIGGFDDRFRLYGEDIDLCYRAGLAGWERWYVPEARVCHRHAALTDRRLLTVRTVWHWRGIARFVRKHPERLRALR